MRLSEMQSEKLNFDSPRRFNFMFAVASGTGNLGLIQLETSSIFPIKEYIPLAHNLLVYIVRIL